MDSHDGPPAGRDRDGGSARDDHPLRNGRPGQDDLDADALLSALTGWAADSRAREAAAERARERWLRQQAQEAATWLGVLVDLAEHGLDVTLTLDGRSVTGTLAGVGEDLCVVAHAGGTTLVALAHVRAVRAAQGSWVAGSDRRPALRIGFPDALAALAAERSPVAMALIGGSEVRGALVAVGTDVATLRTTA
ncbi:MAG: hypothetical protein ACYCUG_11845, partial [Acidimicrobiales bacterium]